MKIYLHAAVIMVFCLGCVACVWLVSGGWFGQTKCCTVTLYSISSGPVASHCHCLFIWSLVLVILVRFLSAQHLMFLWVLGLHFLTGFIIHMSTGGWQIDVTLEDPTASFSTNWGFQQLFLLVSRWQTGCANVLFPWFILKITAVKVTHWHMWGYRLQYVITAAVTFCWQGFEKRGCSDRWWSTNGFYLP